MKSLQPFTIPTGMQLSPDSIMQLIWCGSNPDNPALQEIVVTIDMAYTIFCAWYVSCASLKSILSRYYFEIREYN
jgi:hypothetical protein